MSRLMILVIVPVVQLVICVSTLEASITLTDAEQQVTSFSEFRREWDRIDIELDHEYDPPDLSNPLGLAPADLYADSSANGLSGWASLTSVFPAGEVVANGAVFQSAVWGQQPDDCHDVHGGSHSGFRLFFRCEAQTSLSLAGSLTVGLDGYPELSPAETFAYVRLFTMEAGVPSLLWEDRLSGADATDTLTLNRSQDLEAGQDYLFEARAKAGVRADPIHSALKARTASFSFTLDLPGSDIGVAPARKMGAIIDFFANAVEEGTLAGEGKGKSAENRLNAFRNMLQEALHLIEAELDAEAVQQLRDAYKACDGLAVPLDFVAGDARAELADKIDELIQDMEG